MADGRSLKTLLLVATPVAWLDSGSRVLSTDLDATAGGQDVGVAGVGVAPA
jgi:hypothetical protein